MTINAIQQLSSDYWSAEEFPPDYTLDFIARNTILFSNIKTFKDAEELELYIELSSQHLYALLKKDRYNETVNNAIKYLQIIDTEIDRLKLSSSKDDGYYELLLCKGMAIYCLRDYTNSTTVFKHLVTYDNKNESYKQWLSTSLYRKRMWISRTIAIIGVVLLAIEIFFSKFIPSHLSVLLYGIASIGLIGTSIYDYYMKRNLRKSQTK